MLLLKWTIILEEILSLSSIKVWFYCDYYPINSNIHQNDDDNSFAFFFLNNWWVWKVVNIHVQALKVEHLKYPEVKRRDAVFTRRSCTVLKHPWVGRGRGRGGCQPPLPKKALFVLLSLIFFKIANEIRAFLDNNVEGSGAEKSLIQFILAMRSFI